jgi:hypothetical protein
MFPFRVPHLYFPGLQESTRTLSVHSAAPRWSGLPGSARPFSQRAVPIPMTAAISILGPPPCLRQVLLCCRRRYCAQRPRRSTQRCTQSRRPLCRERERFVFAPAIPGLALRIMSSRCKSVKAVAIPEEILHAVGVAWRGAPSDPRIDPLAPHHGQTPVWRRCCPAPDPLRRSPRLVNEGTGESRYRLAALFICPLAA